MVEKVPGWRWCLNPQCRSGQVHQSPVEVASKLATGDDVQVEGIVDAATKPKADEMQMVLPDRSIASLKNILQVAKDQLGGSFGQPTTVAKKPKLKGKRPAKAKPEGHKLNPIDLDAIVPDDDIFTCKECGHKACVPCDRPWHDGETCKMFKKRLEEENKQSEELIEKVCKACPKCKKPIEKNGGCDHMYCE